MKCPFCESPERPKGGEFTCGTFERRGRNDIHTVTVQVNMCRTIQHTQILVAAQELMNVTGTSTIRDVVKKVRELVKSKEAAP